MRLQKILSQNYFFCLFKKIVKLIVMDLSKEEEKIVDEIYPVYHQMEYIQVCEIKGHLERFKKRYGSETLKTYLEELKKNPQMVFNRDKSFP